MVQGVEKNEKTITRLSSFTYKITSETTDYHCHTLHEVILLVSYSPKLSTTKKEIPVMGEVLMCLRNICMSEFKNIQEKPNTN